MENSFSTVCRRCASFPRESRSDAYGYNVRNELISASKTGGPTFSSASYAANNLNQYTSVSNCNSSALSASPREEFIPQFDADGNQTLIETATGIWSVTYNGENRPTLWSCIQSNNSNNPNNQTILSMSFDRMGRRVTKNDQRFVYDGYLQIANFELRTSNIKPQAFIWDPTEPVATRPLSWVRVHSTAYYTYDGNKNASEVVDANGIGVAHYEYAPFGALVVQRGENAIDNSWRFSGENFDDALGLVSYNYRHHDPIGGRWLSRDPENEYYGNLDYLILKNNPIDAFDLLGLKMTPGSAGQHCQKYIDIRDDEESYDKHTPDPDSLLDSEKAVCAQKINEVLNSRAMKKIRAQFGGSCKEPVIECKCCDWYTSKDGSVSASVLGIYWRDTRDITYCWNNHKRKSKSKYDMQVTLIHELTHALQHCAGYGNNCTESLKKEIGARRCSGECADFDGCLKRALQSSCITSHCVTAAEASNAYAAVKEWYDAKRTKSPYAAGGFCNFANENSKK